MYDIKFLEEQWEQYQKKKRRPFYILAVIIFLIFLIGSTFLLKDSDLFSQKLIPIFGENRNSFPKLLHSHIWIDEALSDLQMEENEVLETLKPTVKTSIDKSDISTLEVVEDISQPKELSKTKPVIKKTKKPYRKKVALNIIKSSSPSSYQDVEQRFRELHESDDSIFLAKTYYKKGEYKKAIRWAMATNNIDANLGESWMILAKAKDKLGYHHDAIIILKGYIKRSNSTEAKRLLVQLKRHQKNSKQEKDLGKKTNKKLALKIIKSSDESAYKDVEKRFNGVHNSDDSLFLARVYYKQKKYNKAEFWALQTNKVNANIHESWMILVKSKNKQGDTKKAIEILTNYLKYSNSSEAKNLLQQLKGN